MTNRDLLKEAIADAKAVKETAIANAKLALEEAFTPYLKEKLAAKLAEIDEEEMTETTVDESKEEIEENFDLDETETMDEDMELEEMDLDELLKELDDLNDEESLNENETEETEETEETFDIENMSEEDLKSFIESVITDMIASGELEGDMETEDEEMEMTDDEDEEVDLNELIFELTKEKSSKNQKENVKRMSEARRGKIKKDTAKEEDVENYKKKLKEAEDKLEEAYSTIKSIKSEINEVNLLNAKLLYTNKIFKSKNLTESQKVKILETFDKATNVKEVKLIYETFSTSKTTPNNKVHENIIGKASKTIIKESMSAPIIEVNEQFARWQKLAGIKK
jgi:hypothetical protein